MTDFHELANHITERIQSAPVESWLKDEAKADLRRLVSAHESKITSMHVDYATPTEKIGEARHEYTPSDFELRQTAVHASNGNPAAAREFYRFLKGDA